MELAQILDRFIEGLLFVDRNTDFVGANRRTGEVYLPGVKTMNEPKFVEELLDWWRIHHADDFRPANASDREVPYVGLSRASCDLVFSTDGSPLSSPEWSIEVKHIALVGNNGKNNDYGVQKILSPYLKDRSLIHDIERLGTHGKGKRKAAIGYCFDYNFDTCAEALRVHPQHSAIIHEIREVCRKNDSTNGSLSVIPMIEFADEIFQRRNLVKPVITKSFADAWRHPCGGHGYVWGWELLD